VLPPLSTPLTRAWWGPWTVQPTDPLCRSGSSKFGVQTTDAGAFGGASAGLCSAVSFTGAHCSRHARTFDELPCQLRSFFSHVTDGTYNRSVRAVSRPSVLQKDPGRAKRQGGRRLTRGRPWLVLREEIFAWSKRPRSRAAGGSGDGANLPHQTAPFSFRSLAAASTRMSWRPALICTRASSALPPRAAPARSAVGFARASSAWLLRATPASFTRARKG
jgi:hypothetical protein